MAFPGLAVIGLIRGYQLTIGRLLPQRCRFHPTCSAYAVEAIRVNGLIRGGLDAGWRLLRCGPWSSGGVDHVRVRGVRGEVARG